MSEAIWAFVWGTIVLELFTDIPSTLVRGVLGGGVARKLLQDLREENTRLRSDLANTVRIESQALSTDRVDKDHRRAEVRDSVMKFLVSTGRTNLNLQEFCGGQGAQHFGGPEVTYEGPELNRGALHWVITQLQEEDILGPPYQLHPDHPREWPVLLNGGTPPEKG
jgi:hypothetical protein